MPSSKHFENGCRDTPNIRAASALESPHSVVRRRLPLHHLESQSFDPFEVTAVPGQKRSPELQADARDGQIGHGKGAAPHLAVRVLPSTPGPQPPGPWEPATSSHRSAPPLGSPCRCRPGETYVLPWLRIARAFELPIRLQQPIHCPRRTASHRCAPHRTGRRQIAPFHHVLALAPAYTFQI